MKITKLIFIGLLASIGLSNNATAQEMVKDIYPGSNSSNPTCLINVNGTLFFKAKDSKGVELWKSNGTAAGTVMVKDIWVTSPLGNPGSLETTPNDLTNVNGTVYFTANANTNIGTANNLWKSNGTDATTVMVKTNYTFPADSSLLNVKNLTNVNGTLYFSAISPTSSGYDLLWKSDGTRAGTVFIKDIKKGTFASFTDVNGVLFYIGGDGGTIDKELWKSDGTGAGTVLVKNINPNPFTSSFPQAPNFTLVNGSLYFNATDGTNNGSLWKSDGTDAGTVMVKNVSPLSMININGTIYFGTLGTGGELWKSDGTTAGTIKIKDGFPGGIPQSLTNVNGTLFFIADDATHGFELWKSNGTTAGTVMVKDINPGTGLRPNANIQYLTNCNGILYFSADDGVNGAELWKSDGSVSGTIMVKDIQPGGMFNGSFPANLININGTLYFSANDGTNGIELWKYTFATDVSQTTTYLPQNYTLLQNYPNPFNPSTKIQFEISSSGFVSLKVFDVLGREVSVLVNEYKPAGNYEVNFDASILSSSVYFYKLQTGNFSSTKKMVLMR